MVLRNFSYRSQFHFDQKHVHLKVLFKLLYKEKEVRTWNAGTVLSTYGDKSMHHTNQTSIRDLILVKSSQYLCVLEIFVCVHNAASVWSDKRTKVLGSVFPSHSVFFFFSLILPWHQATGANMWHWRTPNKTLHSDKTDVDPDALFQYYAYCFLLMVALLTRPASISYSVTLWSELGWFDGDRGAERQRNMTVPHVVLPSRGRFMYWIYTTEWALTFFFKFTEN